MQAASRSVVPGCGTAAVTSPKSRPSRHNTIITAAPPQRHGWRGGSSGGACRRAAALQRQLGSHRRDRAMVAAHAAACQDLRAKAEAAGVKVDPSSAIIELLQKADAFTFDVDSTFCSDESIDEIAAFLGVGEQVAALTAKAMGGSVPFEQALASRLGVMQPSQEDLRRFLEQHPPKISPGIPELVQLLRAQGKQVFLVSGGFRAVIHPIAEMLGIPLSHVFANTILFNEDGSYSGFDPSEFPSRSGGKAEAVKHIKKAHGYQTVIMVGDGITDFEARTPGGADAFIGYGGVVYRENVAQLSDWYVFEIPAIAAALQQAST